MVGLHSHCNENVQKWDCRSVGFVGRPLACRFFDKVVVRLNKINAQFMERVKLSQQWSIQVLFAPGLEL